MIPQLYATDSQTKATELAATIASASLPPQIVAACDAVESFLRKHTPDQQRWFFSITFPTLICRVFGFDDSSPPSSSPAPRRQSPNGWIDLAASGNDSELSGKIFSLLSPIGILVSSISEVDRLSLVKYVFPMERLPEWVRYMLQNYQDYQVLAELCPLFKNRVKEDSVKASACQIQLNVFEYFFFWFAYYPVCRGSSEGSETVKVQRTKKFKLENWSYSIPGLSSTKRGSEKKTEGNLYIQLLYVYLHTFVPVYDQSVHRTYRSSLLHYSSGCDSSAFERAEFVVNTLIHFWLVDNDFSPLPVGVCKSLAVAFPLRFVLGETPPTPGLGDATNVFVKYLNLASLPAVEGHNQIESVGNSMWWISGSSEVKSRDAVLSLHSVGTWNILVQRPLYRYILRTFLFCPVETSIKNASQAFSVWISYLEPWSNSLEEFADLDELVAIPDIVHAKDITKSLAPGYSSFWKEYILSNYLFYSSLVMHFIGFAHKFLHTDAEAIVQMVAKVLNILTSSFELMNLLKQVNAVFHSNAPESSKLMFGTLQGYIPKIHQQLQDWEDGLCESDADGSFLYDNWNKDLRLFSDAEAGGQQLLQLFLLRAESELQSESGKNLAQNLQCLNSLKEQVSRLFGGSVPKSSFGTPEARQSPRSCDDIFKPRRYGNHMGAEIKYKGEWMRRPVSDDEIAWLAKLLVSTSDWLNEKLGLNQVECIQRQPAFSYVEIPGGVKDVHGAVEVMKVVFCYFLSCIVWLGEAIVQFMRAHGLRVNLRMLASKKVVAAIFIVAAFNLLRRAFSVQLLCK